jgi:hypothetical protein
MEDLRVLGRMYRLSHFGGRESEAVAAGRAVVLGW